MPDSLSPEPGRAMTQGRADASKYHFDFVVEFSDFRHLNRSAYQRSTARKLHRVIWVILIIAAVILLGVPAVYPDAFVVPVSVQSAYLGTLVGVSAVTILNVFFADVPRKLRYKKAAIAGRRLVYHLSDEGISLNLDGMQSKIAWSAIQRLDVHADGMLLFLEPNQAFIVARRGIAEADWPAAVAYVTERCAKPA